MSTFIVVLFFLSLFHFVYDGIILPSVRMNLRNQLFLERDKLREMLIQNGIAKTDTEFFDFLHDGINFYLNRLHILNIVFYYSYYKEIVKNEELRGIIEKRSQLADHSNNKELKKIYNSVNLVLSKAFVFNALTFTLVLFPVALIVLILKTVIRIFSMPIRGLLSVSFLQPIKNFVSMPNQAAKNLGVLPG